MTDEGLGGNNHSMFDEKIGGPSAERSPRQTEEGRGSESLDFLYDL